MSSINDDWFVIKDIMAFINESRKLVFNTHGTKSNDNADEIDNLIISQEDEEDLDKILSYSESLTIMQSFLKKQKNKKTNEYRYLINEDLYVKALQSMGDRMTSNILHSLVNKGLIEMAFDNEGKHRQGYMLKNPSKQNCQYCPFKDRKDLCDKNLS